MAVSGADWRKPTDGYRTGTAEEACSGRSVTGGLPAASDPDTSENGRAVVRTLADNTDKNGSAEVLNTVETDDRTVSGPPAIGVTTETAIVTEWPDNGHADSVDGGAPGKGSPTGHDDGDGIYLRYFIRDSGTRRSAVIVE